MLIYIYKHLTSKVSLWESADGLQHLPSNHERAAAPPRRRQPAYSQGRDYWAIFCSIVTPAFIACQIHLPTSLFFLFSGMLLCCSWEECRLCCTPPSFSLKFTYDKMPSSSLLTAGQAVPRQSHHTKLDCVTCCGLPILKHTWASYYPQPLVQLCARAPVHKESLGAAAI